jgi:hypothetical protein
MKDDWVPIDFPADIAKAVGEWLEAADGSLGLCLVCGASFGEADMIPDRPGYHNCPCKCDERIRQDSGILEMTLLMEVLRRSTKGATSNPGDEYQLLMRPLFVPH